MTPLFDFALPESGRACRECGSAITKKPGPGRFPAYCSDECRQAEPRRLAQEKRPQRADSGALRTRRHRRHSAGDHSLCRDHITCWICGKPMISHVAERPTCAACRRKHGAGVCSKCGGPKRTAKPGMCRSCRTPSRPAEPRIWICELCECEYIPKPMHRPNQRCCSKSCAQAWRNGARPPYVKGAEARATRNMLHSRTRKLRHAQTWDGITDEEILERDGWRCQIPGCKRRPIRKDLKYPHPRSKSIDHIIPLSLGGDDTAVNKRAAHFACNLRRGNRMSAEQLPLFGVIREPPLVTVTAGERAVMFQRRKRFCGCGAIPLKGRKLCQACLDQRAVESLRPCEHCGELFIGRQERSRYCSRQCNDTAYNRQRDRVPVISKICEVCGREFMSTAKSLAKTCGDDACRRKRQQSHKRECRHEGCHRGANRAGGLCSRHSRLSLMLRWQQEASEEHCPARKHRL